LGALFIFAPEFVMPGLVPGLHALIRKTRMAGTSSAKRASRLWPDHDENRFSYLALVGVVSGVWVAPAFGITVSGRVVPGMFGL
jgi:hypothetical protein